MRSDEATVTADLRDRLAEQLQARGHLHDPLVAKAFRTVPRHLFVPAVEPARAYEDAVVATKWSPDGTAISSSSQPSMMAIMLEQLALRAGHRVLEIGAGTGYNAALMAQIVGDAGTVVSLDIDEDLVRTAREHLTEAGGLPVTVVRADADGGWPDGAPYDRIVLTVAADRIIPAWVDQLGDGGRLVLPLAGGAGQASVAYEKRHGQLIETSRRGCAFMPLRGPSPGR